MLNVEKYPTNMILSCLWQGIKFIILGTNILVSLITGTIKALHLSDMILILPSVNLAFCEVHVFNLIYEVLTASCCHYVLPDQSDITDVVDQCKVLREGLAVQTIL